MRSASSSWSTTCTAACSTPCAPETARTRSTRRSRSSGALRADAARSRVPPVDDVHAPVVPGAGALRLLAVALGPRGEGLHVLLHEVADAVREIAGVVERLVDAP